MISIDYINGSICMETEQAFHPYELFFESCLDDINKACANISMIEDKMLLESSIMGSNNSEITMIYESEKKSVLANIGEKVIAIFKKFASMIDMVISKIKNYSFSKKSDIQKLEILLKEHPDLKSEAITAFNNGSLNLSDVKSLSELDKSFDEIVKLAKKKEIDSNTLRGKWEKAKEKFNNDEKKWKVVKVAAATTTIVTAIVAVKTFHSKCLAASNSAQKDKQEMNTRKSEVYSALTENGVISEDTGKAQTLLAMYRDLNGKHAAARNEHLSVIEKMNSAIASFVDKHSSSDTKERFHKDMNETHQREVERKEKEKRAREDEKYSDAYTARRAQNKADYDDRRKKKATAYQQAVGTGVANKKFEYDKAYTAKAAQIRAERESRKNKNEVDADLKYERDKAYEQQLGRQAAENSVPNKTREDNAYYQRKGQIRADKEVPNKTREDNAYYQRKGQIRADKENNSNTN